MHEKVAFIHCYQLLKIMEEIAKEILETIRWIPLRERNSKTYMEYLDKANFDMKVALEQETDK